MSDKIQDETNLIEKEKINFGEKLKSTRENMGLSIQEAAARLHLRPRFISMLENENLAQSSLPLIYLRGYLRSYSKLLNIPEQLLNPILEKLDPEPLILNPEPLASDSLSLPFPEENNSYYARITTLFISLALLTSITAWWYLHANTNPHMEIAQQQAPNNSLNNPESNSLTQPVEAALSAPPSITSPLIETAAKSPPPEQAALPNNPAVKKPALLASVASKQNIRPLGIKPTSPQGDADDDVDELE